MSPGNSYFKDEVVRELLKKVVDVYGRAAILIADVPAVSTYVALGYPQNRAWRDKALPQGNNLRNRVLRAMKDLGYTDAHVRIIDWQNEIEDNSQYKYKYDQVTKLYATNSIFKIAADAATKTALESFGKEIINIEQAIKIAVQYLISEIAFMEYAPAYLGIKKVTYIYHKGWTVFESYIKGEFDGVAKPYLGFEIVTI